MRVGLLKTLYPLSVLDEDKLARVLSIAKDGFQYPGMISKESDRTPAATVCLLELLLAKTEREDHKELIRAALSRVIESCRSYAEPLQQKREAAFTSDPENDHLAIQRHLSHSSQGTTSTAMKRYSCMGDGVGVGILKALYSLRPLDETKLRIVISIVHFAFEYPGMIVRESDRTPAVTVCLLELLLTKTGREDHKELIRAALTSLTQISTDDTDPACPR